MQDRLLRQDLEESEENSSIQFRSWFSLQAGRNMCFQFQNASRHSRVILFKPSQNSFTVENRVDAKQESTLPMLVNAWDTYVYLIGGYGPNKEGLETVWRYDLVNDTYDYDMPSLNNGRA